MKLKWPQKNPQKQGRILEGGGKVSGWPENIPLPAAWFHFAMSS